MPNTNISSDEPESQPMGSEGAYFELVDWGIFGQLVRTLRDKEGLSQKQLGDLCGLGDSYISQIEGGLKDNVSIKVINRLAKEFHTQPKWLMYLASTPDMDQRVDKLHWKIVRIVIKKLKIYENFKDVYLNKYSVEL